MGACIAASAIIPVTPKKRYRFFMEWASDSTSNALTVYVRWYNGAQATLATWTIFSAAATTANTWQVNARHLVPPEGARYARIRLSKGANASKYGINRIELKEHANNLEHHLRQILIKDDFCSPTIGELPWQRYDISGHIVATKVNAVGAFGDWSEIGITRLTTGVTSGYGGVIHLEQLAQGAPPIGSEFRCKVKMQDTTNISTWVGLWSAINTNPDEALSNSISGIGFRNEATGSGENWFGVVRTATTETTQDMGVAGGAWCNLGWYMTDTGIQFTVKGEAVGSVKTTNIPTSDLLVPVFGALTKTSAAREVDIDFFALQLFLDRL
jgi:hypothetical protein